MIQNQTAYLRFNFMDEDVRHRFSRERWKSTIQYGVHIDALFLSRNVSMCRTYIRLGREIVSDEMANTIVTKLLDVGKHNETSPD